MIKLRLKMREKVCKRICRSTTNLSLQLACKQANAKICANCYLTFQSYFFALLRATQYLSKGHDR